MVPGSRWEDVKGTDQRLAEALARERPVLWLDPPLPLRVALRSVPSLMTPARLFDAPGEEVAPGVVRLRIVVPGGITRWGLGPLYARLAAYRARRWMAVGQIDPIAVVLSSPWASFPSGISGTRCYYVTDDWSAGSALMGAAAGRVQQRMKINARKADLVATVTPTLAAVVEDLSGTKGVRVLPNGCTPAVPPVRTPLRRRAVAVLGQLNERLDLNVLEAVQEAGIPLEVAGPRRDHEPAFVARLSRLLEAPGVTWHGQLDPASVPAFLGATSVGLTPYADSAFNRASFPLKTLDYLAAGLPVVSTDLPSARWLGGDLVRVGQDDGDVVRALKHYLTSPFDDTAAQQRRQAAEGHSWDARARMLLSWLDDMQ